MKQIINKIIMMLLTILLVASSVLVTDENRYYKYVFLVGFTILIMYFIIRMIKKKPIKVIKSKLDICVILLITSTIMPLIFNTYVSLFGTVQTILQYLYVLGLYLIIREITQEEKGFCKLLFNAIIIFAVIIVIIGIDLITTQKTECLLNIIDIESFQNGENRITSVYCYPNTLAAYIASVIFLNMNEGLKKNKKYIRAVYKTINFILILGIILTYCKAIFVIMPILLCIYIMCIKDKSKRIEIVQDLMISLIFSMIYVAIFEKVVNTQNYLIMWATLLSMTTINYLINIAVEENKIIVQLLSKKGIIFLSLGAIVFLVYIVIGLNVYGEYSAITENIESNYGAKILNKIEGNTKYVLEFDIVANTPKKMQSAFTINIIERDNKNRDINKTQVEFSEYEGIKTIELTTKESTAEMKIEFISQYVLEGKSLTVRNLKVNQKEIPLEYKYLPTTLVEKVKNISINYKTSRERIEMIKDALELSTQNILTGAGGGAWQYKYKEVQDYEYESKILHSYPAKVALEFGVIGIIAYVGIGISMIVILIQLVKKQNVEMIAILFAFALLGIHFVIDVDMEYMHIIVFTFMLMGVISTELKSKENSSKWLYVQNGICLFLIIVGIYLTLNQSSYNKYEKTFELIEQANALVANSKENEELNYEIAKGYEDIIKFERYNEIENYYEMTKYYLNSNDENKAIKLEECYKKVASYENKNSNNIERISLKIKCAYSMINELEKLNNPQYYEVTEKFINIILEEYEKTKSELEQYMANQQIDIQNYINGLEKLYKDVTELKSTYLMGTKVWNESDIQIDENELRKLEIEEVKDVFIYHTHGTESYKADKKYETYKFYKSLDKNYNVTKIGEELTKLLKQKEINVIHNTTYYNYPKENEDYRNARRGTKKILDKNEQVNRIIDVHRDAYSEEKHNASTIEINGEKVANLRFVIGINKEDKNWLYDLKWAIEMQKQANKKYPGLMQPILIREENYNQDLGKYAILIEVGENCNKVEHALNSIKYFAEIFM